MNTTRRPSEDRNRREKEMLDMDGLSSLSPPRWIIAVIFLVFIGLAAAGAGLYRSQWRQFSRSAENELSTVARLKVDQIAAWREDQIEDAALLAEYPPFVQAVEMIVAGRQGDVLERLTTFLTFYQRNNDLNEVLLMDMEGRIRLSLNGGRDLFSGYKIPMAEALRSGRPVVTELHSGIHRSQPHVSVLAPVFSGAGANRVPLGVVVLVNEARRFLCPLLRSWPTLSRSAETYLVMREGSDALFLNDVRHGKDTALKLRIPLSRNEVSAVMAVNGGQGVFRARDYRGIDVMSAVMRVPGSSWLLVAEIDADEVYEEWNQRSLLFLVLFLLLAGFLAAVGHAYWQRHRKARFQAMYLAEARLNATIERHGITLRAIADAVISTDPDGRVELMNPVAEEMTGWSSEEAEGKTLSEVFRVAGAETGAETDYPLNGGAREMASAGYDGNGLLITRDGREIPIAVSSAPIRDEQGEVSGVVLAFRDRTGERNAQRLQSARLELLEYQVTHSLDDFLARALDLIGGMVESPAGFYHFVVPDQRTLFFRQGSHSFVKVARGAGGLETGYSIGRPDIWEDAVRSGKAVVRNDRRQAPGEEMAGGRVEFIRHLAVPIVRDGAVKAVLGVGNKPTEYLDRDVEIVSYLADLTWEIIERKRAEEEQERLRAQLDQARKMESVGRLAGGVAHDFNNMLGVILGHAELALMKLDHTHPLQSHLSAILKATERSADLTRQLLAFARKQTIMPRALNLNEAVEGLLVILERLIGEDIQLVWHPGEDIWTVKMDPSQLDQILTNLCVNARDAVSGVGKIVIETSNMVFGEEYQAVDAEFSPGEFVMLAVSDDGGGMDGDTMEKIFDPFFTTKGVGEGTGLGLATVYGIVKQNNGFIKVYSEPGLGAAFRIFLPRHGAAAVECGDAAPEPLRRGHETILLVEDEAAILEIGRVMLENLGYSVLAAGTPADAIRLAEERRGMIDLLLTDVIMPEMNGRELAKNLHSLYPDLACLFMSGYTADVIAHRGVMDEGVNFIQKPFTSRGLSVAVRLALEKKSPVADKDG